MQVLGQATTLRAAYTYGQTYLQIASWAPFSTETGSVLVGGVDVCAYTSGTTVSGSETLASVSGLTRDWPEGTEVRALVTVNDASAQTTLASLLGGGMSGVAVSKIEANSANSATGSTIGANYLGTYSGGVTEVRGRMTDIKHTGATALQAGTIVTLNITAPATVSGSYRTQTVTLTPRRVSGVDRWQRAFVAAPVNRYNQALQRVMGV